MNVTYGTPMKRDGEYTTIFTCTDGENEYPVGGSVSFANAAKLDAKGIVLACLVDAERHIEAWCERMAHAPEPDVAAPDLAAVQETISLDSGLTATRADQAQPEEIPRA